MGFGSGWGRGSRALCPVAGFGFARAGWLWRMSCLDRGEVT